MGIDMQQGLLSGFNPSDALPAPRYTGMLLPIERDMYGNKGNFELAFPQFLQDAYSGINKFGQVFRGELSPQEIQQLAFDTSLNVAGGGLLGSKIIPNAVPEGALGIFAGKSAVNFPAKSLLQHVDKSKINNLNEQYSLLKEKIYSDDLTPKQRGKLNDQEVKLINNIDAENFKVTNQENKVLEPLDKFMEKQDYRKGMPNQTSRFFGSEREFGTGLFQMPDGKYRFEIDDTKASLKDLPMAINYDEAIDMTKDAFPNLLGVNLYRKALSPKKLSDIIDHKELFDNYPQLKNTDIAFVDGGSSLGSYYPKENFIIVNLGKVSKDTSKENIKDRVMSIILHEIQHNVQDIENFARGSNMSSGQQNIAVNIEDAQRKLGLSSRSADDYRKASEESRRVNNALYLKDLKRKSIEGSQPKYLFSQQDWYKYGDRIRSQVTEELGYPYPKVKSPKRDAWQKRAYERLYEINASDPENKYGGGVRLAQEYSERELKNLSKRLERVMDKNFKNKLVYDSQSKRVQALEQMARNRDTDWLAYTNQLGEVEARIVEARAGFDPNLKSENFRPKNPFQNLKQGLFEYSNAYNQPNLVSSTDDKLFERGQGLLTKSGF
jgi:hypothetical protein